MDVREGTGILFGLAGFAVLIWLGSWETALGVFLVLWGHNLEKRHR